MRTPRIFIEQSLSANSQLQLDKNAAHHLTRVLRRKAGDALVVFNGEGGEYPATLTEVSRNGATLALGDQQNKTVESPLYTHLGIAVSKGDRFDWLVQKATEMGVNEISPLLTQRCEVKLDAARSEKKQHHWQQIARSACEQSGRNSVPVVHAIQPLDNWLAQTNGLRFVLAPGEAALSTIEEKPKTVTLLVGPEGGLEEPEITAAENSGFTRLGLGPRVLRTETAPVAALSVLQWQWGDFKPD